MATRRRIAAIAASVAFVAIAVGVPAAAADEPGQMVGPFGEHYEVRATCATDSATAYQEGAPGPSPIPTPAWGWGLNGGGQVMARPWLTEPYNSGTGFVVDNHIASVMVAQLRGASGYRLFAGLTQNGNVVPSAVTERTLTCPDYEALPQTVFRPMTARRVLDTRVDSQVGYVGDRPAAGAVLPMHLGPLPPGAVAAVVTLTVTGSTASGYVQVLPSGSPKIGSWSNLNVDGAGRTVANTVVVPIGASGDLVAYTQSSTHLIADLAGVFVDVDRPAAAGRFAPSVSTRLLDTRTSGSQPGAGSVQHVRVAGAAGLPDSVDVGAVVVNITSTDAAAAGYVEAAAGGALVPGATSVLNVERPGQTVAGMALVPVAADGTIDVFTQSPAHLVVDLVGWFSSESVEPGVDGVFVPLPPERVLDTRPHTTINCCYGDLGAGAAFRSDRSSRTDLFFGGLAVPSLQAVLVNLTATETVGAGYVQADAAGDLVEGATSVLNVPGAGATVPNAAIVAVGRTSVAHQVPGEPAAYDALGITVLSHGGAHMLVDLFGFFT